MLTRIGERAALGLARILRERKTCRARQMYDSGQACFVRERTRVMQAMVVLANLFLWRTQVRILGTKAWREREVRLHAALNGIQVQPVGRLRLRMPVVEGMSLEAILRARDVTREKKMLALRLAVRALYAAHHQSAEGPAGVRRMFAHGDATAGNVIVDISAGRANWIDFETCHTAEVTDAFGHVDDLRALLASTVQWVGEPEIEAVVGVAMEEYPDVVILEELGRCFANRRVPFYHLAQGRIGRDIRLTIRKEIARRLMLRKEIG